MELKNARGDTIGVHYSHIACDRKIDKLTDEIEFIDKYVHILPTCYYCCASHNPYH